MSHGKLHQHLYFRVLLAIAIGIALGYSYPQLGAQMKPLGDGFIKLIKMLIAPIIFCTVVVGIASMENMKKVGRVGLLAVVYFVSVSVIAMFVKLFAKDPLDRGLEAAPSFWRAHEPNPLGPKAAARHQF